MSARRSELTRAAARLFAEKGYHGTSIGDLAEAIGVQKGSLYHHIESKADLLWEVAREGAAAFHAALDAIPTRRCRPTEKIRLALRAHLARRRRPARHRDRLREEWRPSRASGASGSSPSGAATRSGSASSSARASSAASSAPTSTPRRAALLFLSAGNWAYTWLRPGVRHGRARRPHLRRCCSTACAATRRRRPARGRRIDLRLRLTHRGRGVRGDARRCSGTSDGRELGLDRLAGLLHGEHVVEPES